MLQIDKFSRVPVYEQIVQQIETQIALGVFGSGDALPSVRALSLSLGVNPNTLQKAYTELERRGLCQSAPGSGRFVTAHAREAMLSHAKEKTSAFYQMAVDLLSAGVPSQELHGLVDQAEKAGGQV